MKRHKHKWALLKYCPFLLRRDLGWKIETCLREGCLIRRWSRPFGKNYIRYLYSSPSGGFLRKIYRKVQLDKVNTLENEIIEGLRKKNAE